jgi:cobalt-zinc-cadmium efflux system outer membrane protein
MPTTSAASPDAASSPLPRVATALDDDELSRGRLAQAALLPNPIVEIEALPERSSNFELRVEYDVTGLVLAPIRANAAAPRVHAARYRAAAAVVDTGRRARVAFYTALVAQANLAITKRSLDALATDRDAARALAEAGNLTDLDLASHDAAYEEARADGAQIELAAQDAREALVRTLGLHGAETQLALAGTLPALPEAVTMQDDVEARAMKRDGIP